MNTLLMFISSRILEENGLNLEVEGLLGRLFYSIVEDDAVTYRLRNATSLLEVEEFIVAHGWHTTYFLEEREIAA